MKRLIIFLLLFAAIKVAGQTTGYLRFDTVKIMKQNGTCELYIINATKDSLGQLTNIGGGLTRFIKPRVLSDSTFTVGLDTLTIRGANENLNIGSGYRILSESSQEIKTLFPGWGVLIDSTTNTNGITVAVDSATLSAKYVRRSDSTLYATQYDLTQVGTDLVSDIGPLSEIKSHVAAKGIHSNDTVTNYSYASVDSALAYFSSTVVGVNGREFGGWLAAGTSGDSIRVTVPFGVVIGDSQAEGHPGRHGRLDSNGTSMYGWTYPDLPGQISFHLRALTNMRWFNHGIGGQTTAQVKVRFYRDVLAENIPGTVLNTTRTLYQRPNVVIIIAGINDVFSATMTVDQTKENLEWMAQTCQQYGIRCVILNLPGDEISGQVHLKKIAEINKWLASGVMDQYGASIVDYNRWWNDPTYGYDNVHPTALIVDDIHPSQVGYDSLANFIFREARLPVLRQATFYMETSPAGFAGYSRPTSIAINNTSYSLSGTTSTIDITQYVPDSVWIRIDGSSGGTNTGFNHITWFLDNNPTDVPYYTRRTNYSGSQRTVGIMDQLKLVQPYPLQSTNRYKVLDIRHYDTTYKTLTHEQSGADGVTYFNFGTAALTAINTGAVINASGGIASTGVYWGTSTGLYRMGNLQFASNGSATSTGFGISGGNTLSGIDFQSTPVGAKDAFRFRWWNTALTTTLGGTSGTTTTILSVPIGFGDVGNTNQTGTIIYLRPVYNQTQSGFAGGKFIGYYYNPILTSLTNVRHYSIISKSGDNFFNVTSDNTCIGCTDTSATIGAKFQVNGSVKLDLGSDATGDIFYRNSSGLLTRLGVGSNGQVLTLSSGLPSWQAAGGGGGISGSGTAGRVTFWDGASSITSDANLLYSSSNAGTLSLGTSTTVGHLNLGGNRNFDGTSSTTAWGVGLNSAPTTFTDNATSASGSTNFSQFYLQAPTLAASNSSVTVGAPVTLRIEPPLAGTNVTISGLTYGIMTAGVTWLNGVVKQPVGTATHNSTVSHSSPYNLCDATAGNYNVILPDASTYSGVSFTFKRIDGSVNTCTISTTSSQTIDGSTTYSLTALYKYVTVISTGGAWLIVANN